MSVEQTIIEKLTSVFEPSKMTVENESRMHNVPPNSETHFKVLIVSDTFAGLSRVARHRKVHEVLRAELDGGVHALSVRALTEAEGGADAEALQSPKCLGGDRG